MSMGPDQPAQPITADHPAVVLFSEMEQMSRQFVAAAAVFTEIAAAFARQVELAKALRSVSTDATIQ